VFSRREREFLRLLGDGPGAETAAQIERRFPNPVYRRRLLWGIRKKACAATGDWALYSRAAAHDERVVRPRGPDGPAPVPKYTEPLAALFGKLGRLPRTSRPASESSVRRRRR
jgi:hypothetical protein